MIEVAKRVREKAELKKTGHEGDTEASTPAAEATIREKTEDRVKTSAAASTSQDGISAHSKRKTKPHDGQEEPVDPSKLSKAERLALGITRRKMKRREYQKARVYLTPRPARLAHLFNTRVQCPAATKDEEARQEGGRGGREAPRRDSFRF